MKGFEPDVIRALNEQETIIPHVKVRVYCSQWASCGWKGHRYADTMTAKPCPRCSRWTVIS